MFDVKYLDGDLIEKADEIQVYVGHGLPDWFDKETHFSILQKYLEHYWMNEDDTRDISVMWNTDRIQETEVWGFSDDSETDEPLFKATQDLIEILEDIESDLERIAFQKSQNA